MWVDTSNLLLKGRKSSKHFPNDCSNKVCWLKITCQCCRLGISDTENKTGRKSYLSARQSSRPGSTLCSWQRHPKNGLQGCKNLLQNPNAELIRKPSDKKASLPGLGWIHSWLSW